MKASKISFLVLGALLALAFGFVYAGIFNVAADEPHWRLTHWLIESTRDGMIAARANDITAPPLDDPDLIAFGAEHYSEMCTECHLAPGMEDTALRAGLYPKPPELVKHATDRSPEQRFWIIKHGLKMTAMPAWGVTHDDRSIWAIVAFLEKLPGLSPEDYRELTTRGGGEHSHEHEIEAGHE